MRITVISKVPSSEEANVRLGAAVQLLRSEGQDVRVCVTGSLPRARVLAREALEGGSELVVAAGGDGTVTQVVNGLFAGEGASVPLGIIPLGTTNGFATGLGIPWDAEAAARVLLGGVDREIDVAHVNDCCFVNFSTGGFGTDPTQTSASESKRMPGPIATLVHGAMALVHLETIQARFVVDGSAVHAGELHYFAAGNLMSTGADQFAAGTDGGRGRLNIVIIPKLARLDLMAALPELWREDQASSQGVIHLQGESLLVETDQAITVHADGEPLSGQNFHYGIHPRALRVKTLAAA